MWNFSKPLDRRKSLDPTTAASQQQSQSRKRCALQYAEAGFRVFPLGTLSKSPAISRLAGGNGCHDATIDASQIEKWWRERATYNVGIATGNGLLVLDVDGHDGASNLARLVRQFGRLPATPTARTGSDGWHFYFSSAADLGNSAGKLGKGLDTRGNGGYVVGPPSIHPNARRYRWQSRRSILDLPLATLPLWIEERLLPPPPSFNIPHPPLVEFSDQYLRRAIEGIIAEVASAATGERNAKLYKNARRMADLGIAATDIANCLTPAGLACGLNASEIDRTLKSAERGGQPHV